ncbi:MAG: hypothetical protein GTN81_04725 [Proteobacteria bacterium]|nr:hypothetical protein [Pseudomonadota bacterium]
MKKLVTTVILLMIIGLVSADLALAGRVGKRQIRQQKRIHQGIRSGELTRGETRVLQREQRHIQRAKRFSRSDGTVTPQERLRLERAQDRASIHIYRAKHNDVSR